MGLARAGAVPQLTGRCPQLGCVCWEEGAPSSLFAQSHKRGLRRSWGAGWKVLALLTHTTPPCREDAPHPDEDGEESEGDGGLDAAAPQEELSRRRTLPLVGQEAESHGPNACPEGWGVEGEKRGGGGGVRWGERAQEGRLGSCCGLSLPAGRKTPPGVGCAVHYGARQPLAAFYVSLNQKFQSIKIEFKKIPPLGGTGHTSSARRPRVARGSRVGESRHRTFPSSQNLLLDSAGLSDL